MKNSVLLLLLFPFILCAQNTNLPKIKTEKIFRNGKLTSYKEIGKNGQSVFFKREVNVDAPATLFFSEYDNLNRLTRGIYLDADQGLDIVEMVYEKNRTLYYYRSSEDFDQDLFSKMNSPKSVLKSKPVKQLLASKRRLGKLHLLDSNKNVVEEYFITENGDTNQATRNEYKNGKIVFAQSGINNSEQWISRVYYVYDNRYNLVQSNTLELGDEGETYTIEVRNMKYNSDSLLLSEDFYYRQEFRHRIEYLYNDQRQLNKETYYLEDETTPFDITVCEYNAQGLVNKKEITHYLDSAHPTKEVVTYEYTYW